MNYNRQSTEMKAKINAMFKFARFGHARKVAWSLVSGMPVEVRNANNDRMVDIASKFGIISVLDVCIQAKTDLDAPGGIGEPPVLEAIFYHQPEAFEKLILAGANLDVVSREGLSLAQCVSASGNEKIKDIFKVYSHTPRRVAEHESAVEKRAVAQELIPSKA